MQHNKVRWAILGAGKIAHKFAQDFKAVNNAELVAVASRDQERASAFAHQYQIPVCCNYDELYQSPNIDVVYIATPHNFHFEQSLACIQHGKAVLCEKPITINDVQLKMLAAMARDKGVFLMEALWTYFLPAIIKTKAWIDEGAIGALQTIHADFCFSMPYEPSSRLFDPALAGGSLLDLGIYPVALTSYFLGGKPEAIKATATMTRSNVDESTAMILRYKNATAFLYSSVAGRSLNTAHIVGEKGYIHIPNFFKAGTAFLYDESHALLETFDDGRTTWGYDHEIQEVTNCILRGEKQSMIMPHQRSIELHELLTAIRNQIGLHYPME